VDRGGQLTLALPGSRQRPGAGRDDAWRNAYFEIPEIKFQGVNQGPQAAARFALSGKVFFTRVQ